MKETRHYRDGIRNITTSVDHACTCTEGIPAQSSLGHPADAAVQHEYLSLMHCHAAKMVQCD